MSEKLPADDYVRQNLEAINRSLPIEKIQKAYAFSRDMREQIEANRITEQELLRGFKKHLDLTRGRRLIKLHILDKAIVKLCQEHVEKHVGKQKCGMSYSHLLQAMQEGSKEAIQQLLKDSMEHKDSIGALKDRINNKGKVRPSSTIKQVMRTAEEFRHLLDTVISNGILIEEVDSTLRDDAIKNMQSILNTLDDLKNQFPSAKFKLKDLMKELREFS